MEQITHPQRRFQVWLYTVGHRQLLLRSTKSPQDPTRIDILFTTVSFIHLLTRFDGLTISVDHTTSIPPATKYLLRSGTDEGFVIAQGVFVHVDEGEYGDPCFFDLAVPYSENA